jgi:hypothetical protein
MATRLPENNAGTELAKEAVSLGCASACTRKMQFRPLAVAEMAKNATIRLAEMNFMTD